MTSEKQSTRAVPASYRQRSGLTTADLLYTFYLFSWLYFEDKEGIPLYPRRDSVDQNSLLPEQHTEHRHSPR